LWYGVLFACGFILGYWILFYLISSLSGISSFSKNEKKVFSQLTERIAVSVILGTVIGARLGDVIFYQSWQEILKHPLSIIEVWKGGLASHGGAVGILIALAILNLRLKKKVEGMTWVRLYTNNLKNRNFNKAGTSDLQQRSVAEAGHVQDTWPMEATAKMKVPAKLKTDFSGYLCILDLVCIPAALAGVFIRFGNFINQEILGKKTTVAWAVIFGHAADGSPPFPRHPVQIYEAGFYLLVFAFLMFLWFKKGASKVIGKISGCFFLLVFSFRFLIEFFKEEQSEWLSSSFLTMGQYLSLPFIAFGLYLLLRSCTKTKDQMPARFSIKGN